MFHSMILCSKFWKNGDALALATPRILNLLYENLQNWSTHSIVATLDKIRSAIPVDSIGNHLKVTLMKIVNKIVIIIF